MSRIRTGSSGSSEEGQPNQDGEKEWFAFALLEAEFAVFDDGSGLNFEDAKAACKKEGATLARISSAEEFGAVALVTDVKAISTETWIGVEVSASALDSVPLVSFVDAFEDTSFIDEPSVFPWLSGQPSLSDDCVVIESPTGNARWKTLNCDNRKPYICRRSVREFDIQLFLSVLIPIATILTGAMVLVWKEMRERRLIIEKISNLAASKVGQIDNEATANT